MQKKKVERRPLENLKSHSEAYVTIGQLAAYWLISRKQIYKQIEAGTLRAIRLGPRLLRIRTADAIEFEQRANMQPSQQKRTAARAALPVKLRAQRAR